MSCPVMKWSFSLNQRCQNRSTCILQTLRFCWSSTARIFCIRWHLRDNFGILIRFVDSLTSFVFVLRGKESGSYLHFNLHCFVRKKKNTCDRFSVNSFWNIGVEMRLEEKWGRISISSHIDHAMIGCLIWVIMKHRITSLFSHVFFRPLA